MKAETVLATVLEIRNSFSGSLIVNASLPSCDFGAKLVYLTNFLGP